MQGVVPVDWFGIVGQMQDMMQNGAMGSVRRAKSLKGTDPAEGTNFQWLDRNHPENSRLSPYSHKDTHYKDHDYYRDNAKFTICPNLFEASPEIVEELAFVSRTLYLYFSARAEASPTVHHRCSC